MGAAATVVNGTLIGKSAAREWISVRRMTVASAIVTSNIAKWSPMQERGPAPKGRYADPSEVTTGS